MDTAKRNQLVDELNALPGTPIIPIARFFDGNDDTGSIGCNLFDHPGIPAFAELLTGLTNRPDVSAVHAQIAEIDPGEDSWPFTDTLYITGTITDEDLATLLAPLEPDEIGPAIEFGAPEEFLATQAAPVLAAWWD